MFRRILFYFFLCLPLLVFTGCGDAPIEENITSPPTTTPRHVATDGQQAFLHCLQQGYSPELRFDVQKNNTILFCVFGPTSACYADAFFQDTCTPTSTQAFDFPTDGFQEEGGECSDPSFVCGEDGYTYANGCIAELQKVRIIHTGACIGDTSDTVTTSTPSSPNDPSTPFLSPAEDEEWLDTLTGFRETESDNAGAIVEECRYGQGIVYFSSQKDCPTCFSTLYNSRGETLCHPSNDFSNECPSYFSAATRSRACSTLWEK
ncbi:MAG: hypothetical protein HN726_00780 [Candidatus Magasanikbacteria bacterium]|jgi:hypothetical protein|nr:hypothetical protein [Candidatus Magasanikbacteria bacterium]MBT4220672.1 hypothetical protein [Candidatus Magasanikbacteria bacterium]MBT4350380.1 hypothetical protein [Candidatus Magasanikbacteria bacterium]MBT4541830.1 hypothetical protein [Candidatus Magasanikbacteria bacterium]MBT6252760.1 hypothetical protein [Candidatus Magasanikbacteria bacterium]